MQNLRLKLPNYKRSCRPGIPVAPRALRFEVKEGYDERHKSVLLRWWPSQIFDDSGAVCQIQKLVGYRIYVNGYPKGMIKPHKNRALVEGLRLQHEYKITVVAIGTIGESAHSNAAIIYVPGQLSHTDRPSSKERLPETVSSSKRLPMEPKEVESIDHINNEILIQKAIEESKEERTSVEIPEMNNSKDNS